MGTGRASAAAIAVRAWAAISPAGAIHTPPSARARSTTRSRVTTRDGRPDMDLAVDRAAAYELGTGDAGHGVPIQPFADG